MNPDVSHLARVERRGDPPAASLAGFALLQLQRINDRLMFACDELASRDDEGRAAA